MKKLIVHRNIALLATISMVVLSLFMLNMARADSWSWTTGIPTTVYSDEVSPNDDWNNMCASKFQSIRDQRKIEGVEDQSRQYNTECLIGSGDNYQLFEGDDGKLAVSFAGESNAHLINSGATCYYGCVYMPSRDYLISIQSPGTFGDGKVFMFKDFVKRLHMQRITLPNLRVETYFTGEQSPDEILTDRFTTDDFRSTTKYLQRSQNDKWLVFELVGRGMYRMDMDTGHTTKFLHLPTRYWDPGSAPSMQMDITNDGRFVAIFGRNTSNGIYEIAPGCGFTVPSDPAQLTTLEIQWQLTTECPALYLAAPMNDPANNTYMPNLVTAYQPKFSDDGGEITFYAAPSSGSIRHIRLQAASYIPPKQLDYLALGDSYSSGEGDTENDSQGNRHYREFTNTLGSATEPKERCHISTRSYPYILAQGMNLALNSQWNTVACSGATAWDVKAQGSLAYTGQNDRLKNFNVDALKYQALNEFIPGRQKQVEFVRKYRPKVITLTMGGNDIGFADKVGSCAGLPNICDLVTTNRVRLAQEIRDQYDNLKSLYEELYRASDSTSKIYVIGYPSFMNGDIDAKCETQIGFLTHEEREMISNSITYMNNTIHAASAAVGVEYIDIEHSLLGHRLCDSGDRYITAVTDGLNWNHYKQESYHPNAKGNHEIAMAIWDRLDHVSLMDYNICRVSIGNICPDAESTKASIVTPDYFLSDSLIKKVKYKQMTDTEQNINTPLDIALPNYSFKSASPVTVTLHSDPTYLGTFTAGAYGQLNLATAIPNSIPFGYHTLIISGIDYTGDSIGYEQIIFFEDTNTLSADGRHNIDTQDKQVSYYPSSTGVGHEGNNNQDDTKIHDSASTLPGISGNQPLNNHGKPRARQHLSANVIEHIIKMYLYLVLKIILLLYIR